MLFTAMRLFEPQTLIPEDASAYGDAAKGKLMSAITSLVEAFYSFLRLFLTLTLIPTIT